MSTPSQRANGWMRFWLRKEQTCRGKVKTFLLVTSLLTATGCQVTPVGPITSMKSYEKYVHARIDPLWQHLARENESRLAKGTARFTFEIAPDGRVRHFKAISNTGNSVLAEIATRAILETVFPPVPPRLMSLWKNIGF